MSNYLSAYRRLAYGGYLTEDHDRCPDGSHWDPNQNKCVDTRQELQSHPHGTVLSFQRGNAFSGRRVHALKTPQGWEEVQPDEFYGKMHAHRTGKLVDPEEMVPHAQSGKLGQVVPGLRKGSRVEHPVQLDGLPDGSKIHHPKYASADSPSFTEKEKESQRANGAYTKHDGHWVSDVNGRKVEKAVHLTHSINEHPGYQVTHIPEKND